MDSEKYQLGILGCGNIARLHAERILNDDRAEIAALYDFSKEQAESFRDRYSPNASVHDSVDSLLESDQLDGIVICSPTQFHYEQAIACQKHGLSVLCEKPLADTREKILKLAQLFDQDKPFLTVAYQRRCWSSYRTLKREVDSGRWGKVLAVTGHNVENWQSSIHGTWRDDPEKNLGGYIGDPGSHKLDAVFYVTGLNPVSVYADCDKCGSQVEIRASISARLENDIPLTMSMIGNAQYLDEDFHVHCEKADLMFRHGTVYLGHDGKFEPFADLEPESNPVEGFLDILSGQSPNFAPASCSLPVYDLTHAILKSSREKQEITL